MKLLHLNFTVALASLATAIASFAWAGEQSFNYPPTKKSSSYLTAIASVPPTPSDVSLNAVKSQSSQSTSNQASADAKSVVFGNNAFALDLYRQLHNQKGNLFFSPYSISTALAMTYAGARGQTATEMANVLHLTLEQERLHSAFTALISGLNTSARVYQLIIANRLWGQKGYGFLDTFLKTTQNHYGAKLEQVDFAGATEQTRTAINHWVEQKTQQKVQNLIREHILNQDTKLVLINAIYFKAAWFSPFNPNNTKNQPFTIAPNQQVNVPMMYQEAAVPYADLGDMQLLELPYGDSQLDVEPRLSMVILLPSKADGLAELEQKLTPENLEKWLSSLGGEHGNIEIWLPKFKATSGVELKQVLSEMGMKSAFVPRVANFSGMNGKQNLFISAAIHKAFVDVNELGTEAAATTAAIVTERGGNGKFRADHPFIFLIRDTQSGSILFLGRVANPLESTASVED